MPSDEPPPNQRLSGLPLSRVPDDGAMIGVAPAGTPATGVFAGFAVVSAVLPLEL